MVKIKNNKVVNCGAMHAPQFTIKNMTIKVNIIRLKE